MIKPLDRYTKIGLCILIFGHLIAAYFSFGYHHPDEHFQILEWAQYFIGLNPDSSHLPWEFGAQIRPWFQPILHGGFLKTFSILGIYDPFGAAFFFRMLYAILNIFSLIALWNYFQKKYEFSSRWFLLTSLLWFFPYIHVRTSSENLAGIFLSFALLALVKNSNPLRTFFQAGLLFGFAFLARYQIALGLVGLGIVLLISDRGFRKKHWLLILGFLIPIGFGVLLDRWGYGNWVFTPFQYFKVNLVDHVADRYNPYPWYQYFLWIAQLNPLISIPLFYGVLRYILKNKLDVFATFTISFFILHCFITNKEYRFLLPMINIVPFMAMVYFKPWLQKMWNPVFLTIFIIVNLLSFCISSLHGASVQTHWAVHTVYREFRSYPKSIWLANRDYLDVSHQHYYDLKAVQGFEPHELHLCHSGEELLSFKQKYPDVMILIDGNLKDSLTMELIALVETPDCKLVSRSFPKFLAERFKIPYQVLYHCVLGSPSS